MMCIIVFIPQCRLLLLIEKSIELELSNPSVMGKSAKGVKRVVEESILRYCLI